MSRPRRPLAIPPHWAPAQAEAVLDLLLHLVDQVYAAYQQPLERRAHRDALGLPPDGPDEPHRANDPDPF